MDYEQLQLLAGKEKFHANDIDICLNVFHA